MAEWIIDSERGVKLYKLSTFPRYRYGGIEVYTDLEYREWRRIAAAVLDIYKPLFSRMAIVGRHNDIVVDINNIVVIDNGVWSIQTQNTCNDVIKVVTADIRGILLPRIPFSYRVGKHIRVVQQDAVVAIIDIDNRVVMHSHSQPVDTRILAKVCRYIYENLDRVGTKVTLWDIDYYLARKMYILSDVRALGYVSVLTSLIDRYPVYRVAVPRINTAVCRERGIDVTIDGNIVTAKKRVRGEITSVVHSRDDGFVNIYKLREKVVLEGEITLEYEIDGSHIRLQKALFSGGIKIRDELVDHPNVSEEGDICLGTLRIEDIPIDRELCEAISNHIESITSILLQPNIGSAFYVPPELEELIVHRTRFVFW